jgi:hypothetical protein
MRRERSLPAALGPYQAVNEGIVSHALGYLRSHPIFCLLLLSPGIPEYLSSSSPLNAIFLNPGGFLFQLPANLGLYGPGVLLVREAMVRWKKGWATVLLLGAAYGILEEGIALSTLFNTQAGPVGQLGNFGHWLGVSWVWTAGVLPVHMILSISLPILLLGLALPETRGKSLLSRRGVATAYAILGLDVSVLSLFVVRGEGFWMGWSLFIGSFVVIGILVYSAYKLPSQILRARMDTPGKGPRAMAIAGILFFPGIIFSQFLGMGVGLPPAAVIGLVVIVQALLLVYVVRRMGHTHNERNLVAFAFGILLPIAIFGLLAEIALPVTLLADVAMVLFILKLWRRYGATPSPVDSSV